MDSIMITAVISMVGLTVAFAAVLAFADKKLRVEEDPRIGKIGSILPGVNCGACGYVSCHDFAEHIVKEGADPGKCKILGEEARKELFELTGAEGEEKFPHFPLVRCAAECENKKPLAEYRGVKTCRAAVFSFGGGMQCQYGCMGFGDCVRACPFGALRMEKGLPRLDKEKCTGCGQCVGACPRQLIELVEKRYDDLFYVACNTHDGAVRVKQICGVGCIACGICEKLSPEGFFKVENKLSREDLSKQSKQEEVRALAAKCPTKVIKEL